MNSNVLTKTFQDNLDEDITILTSESKYIPYTISYSAHPNQKKKIEHKVNKLDSGRNRELIELAVKKITEKYPTKKRISIGEILAVLKELFRDKGLSKSTPSFIYVLKKSLNIVTEEHSYTVISSENDKPEIDRGFFLFDLFYIQHLLPTLKAING